MRRIAIAIAITALALVAAVGWVAAPTPAPALDQASSTVALATERPVGTPTPALAHARTDHLRKLKEAFKAGQLPGQGEDGETESEVWLDFVGGVLDPALLAGENIEELFASKEAMVEALVGHSCFVVAHGDPRHPAWQVFLRFLRDEADMAEITAACTQSLPR